MPRRDAPGKDFDDQFNLNRKRGEEKAARGESHWAQDKYLERLNQQLNEGPAHHAKKNESCGEKTVVLLAMLSALGWGLAEVAGKVV